MSDANDLQELTAEATGEVETDAPQQAGDDVEIEIVSIGDEEVGSGYAASGETEQERGELEELRERHLRLRADFENFRKRAERDRTERVRRGVGDALRDLLPVADNLERALAAPGEVDDLRRGVEMIARQLEDVLRRHGVEPIAALGAPFDPQLHEAVAREEGDDVEVPTVIEELQRGYLYGNALLRPSLVRVAMPTVPAAEAEDEEAGDEGGS